MWTQEMDVNSHNHTKEEETRNSFTPRKTIHSMRGLIDRVDISEQTNSQQTHCPTPYHGPGSMSERMQE